MCYNTISIIYFVCFSNNVIFFHILLFELRLFPRINPIKIISIQQHAADEFL